MQDPKDYLEEQLTKILQNNSKESKELSDLKSKLTEITNQLESEQIQSDKLKVQINTLKKPKKNSLQINLSLKEINLKNNLLIKQIKKLKMLNKECIVFNNQLENKIKKLKNVLRNLVEGMSNDILIENELVVEDNYFYENKRVISCEILDFDYKFVNDYSKFITLFLSKLTEYFSELSQKSESFINFQLIDELLTKFSQIISFYEEKEFFFPKLIYKTEENEFNLQIRKVNFINTEQEKKNKPKEYLKLTQENSDLHIKLQESVKEKEELKIKINKIIKESEEIKRKNDELLKVIENIKQIINNLSNK